MNEEIELNAEMEQMMLENDEYILHLNSQGKVEVNENIVRRRTEDGYSDKTYALD